MAFSLIQGSTGTTIQSAIRNPQSAIRNPQSAIFIVFAVMLFVSWRRWLSPIIDSGRELDLPLRLLRGEMLYRDVHYLYPPLAPYYNSLLYRLFLPHLDVLQVSGIVCSVLVVMMSYRLARRLLQPFDSAVAAIAVIVWCVFKTSGNLIFPYAFAALYGMVFALAALLFTLRYAESRRWRELLTAGLFIGLAAITKQEFALASILTVAAALIFLHRDDIRGLVFSSLRVAVPAAAIALPVYAYLFYSIGWGTLVEDCHLFYTHLPHSLIIYNSQRTGLDNPLSSLSQMIGAAAVGVSAACGIVFLSLANAGWSWEREYPGRSRRVLIWSGIALAAACVAIFVIRSTTRERWDGSPLRALPFLLLALIVIEWYRAGRRKTFTETCGGLFIISVYSLAILLRVAMRVPSGGAFGSFFLPTSLILIVYILTQALPNVVTRWAANRLAGDYARRVGRALLIILIATTIVVFAVRFRKNFSYEVDTVRGRFYTRPAIGAAIKQAVDFIHTESDQNEAIAVVPEGSDLAFLSGTRMILRYPIIHPEFMSQQEEQSAITRLQQLRVRYVLIVNRSMSEFGAKAFGRDYNHTLGKWVEEHYRLVKVCGENADPMLQIGVPKFFVKILQSREP